LAFRRPALLFALWLDRGRWRRALGPCLLDLDLARASRDEKKQRVAQLESTLVTAQLGSRADQIRAAEQNLLAQQAALQGAE
jgi:hypothetical protein